MTAWHRRHHARGVAALELALSLPLVLTMVAGLADLGLALRSKMKLANGVAAAAQYAVLDQGAASASTLSGIVQATSGLAGAALTASAAACFCPAGTPATLGAAKCTATCADGASAGSYITLTATYTYAPLLPGYAFVASTNMTDTTTVRVK